MRATANITAVKKAVVGIPTSNVLIIPSWYPSAEHPTAGIFVFQHAQALKNTGHNVAVLYVEQGPKSSAPVVAKEDGITVVRVCVGYGERRDTFVEQKLAGMRYRMAWFGHIQRSGRAAYKTLLGVGFTPDIVHVHALWPAATFARDIKKHYGIPFVVTEHSEEYLEGTDRKLVHTPGMLRFVLRPLAHQASAYIAVSKWFAQRLEQLGLAPHVQVVGNVVPARKNVVPYDAGTLVENGTKRILHVSLLGPAKNLPLLFRAIAQTSKVRQDFVLDIIGDGASRSALESEARDLGILNTYVRFLGRHSAAKINDALDMSAFTVLSSIHETFSVFAVESLMSGRPVLSTRCGGPEEFVSQAVGHLVENNSVIAMTEGLNWMLDNYTQFDPQTLSDYAAARFSEDAICGQLDKIYQGVLKGEVSTHV